MARVVPAADHDDAASGFANLGGGAGCSSSGSGALAIRANGDGWERGDGDVRQSLHKPKLAFVDVEHDFDTAAARESNGEKAGDEPAAIAVASIDSAAREHSSCSMESAANGNKATAQRKFLELDLMQVTKTNPARTYEQRVRTSRTRISSLSTGGRSLLLARLHLCAKRLIRTREFSVAVACVILLNAAYIGLEVDYRSGESTVHEDWWYAVEIIFTLFFFAELCTRFIAESSVCRFASDRWNLFDTVLVSLSCIENFVITPVTNATGQEIGALNALRILRIARLARMVRLIRLFHELWALVAGIVEAFSTLVWAWGLLGLLIYVVGIFTTRTIGKHPSAKEDPLIEQYFGSLARSMFTLFSITTTEGWAQVARTCMKAQPWTWVVFIAFLCVSTFAIMNVVVAVIVENTLDQAGAQREKFLQRQRDIRQASCVKIYKVFCDADTDGNGVITAEEFRLEMENQEVREGLNTLGIDIRQAENLFSMLDYDESGSLDAEEFVGGMMMAVGLARSKDVLAADCDVRRMGRSLAEQIGKVSQASAIQIDGVVQSVQELKQSLEAIARLSEQWRPSQGRDPSQDRSDLQDFAASESSHSMDSPREHLPPPPPQPPEEPVAAPPPGWPASPLPPAPL